MRAQCMPPRAVSARTCSRPLAFLGGLPGSLATGRPSRPPVRVRALPCAGRAVQPLRSRPSVLQPGLFQCGPPRGTAGCGATLPALARRATGPCRSLAALAPSAARAGRDRRRRPVAHRDASGLAGPAARCSTDRERARPGGERYRPRRAAGGRTLPTLCRAAVALGAPGLRAARPATLAGSRGRSLSLKFLEGAVSWSSPPT